MKAILLLVAVVVAAVGALVGPQAVEILQERFFPDGSMRLAGAPRQVSVAVVQELLEMPAEREALLFPPDVVETPGDHAFVVPGLKLKGGLQDLTPKSLLSWASADKAGAHGEEEEEDEEEDKEKKKATGMPLTNVKYRPMGTIPRVVDTGATGGDEGTAHPLLRMFGLAELPFSTFMPFDRKSMWNQLAFKDKHGKEQNAFKTNFVWLDEISLSSFFNATPPDYMTWTGRPQMISPHIADAAASELNPVVDAIFGAPASSPAVLSIATEGIMSGPRYEMQHTVIYQAHGEQLLLLFEPEDRHRLYFHPQLHPARGSSQIHDVFAVESNDSRLDVEQYPRFHRVRVRPVVLKAGDLAYIPAYVPHLTRAITPSMYFTARHDIPAEGTADHVIQNVAIPITEDEKKWNSDDAILAMRRLAIEVLDVAFEGAGGAQAAAAELVESRYRGFTGPDPNNLTTTNAGIQQIMELCYAVSHNTSIAAQHYRRVDTTFQAGAEMSPPRAREVREAIEKMNELLREAPTALARQIAGMDAIEVIVEQRLGVFSVPFFMQFCVRG